MFRDEKIEHYATLDLEELLSLERDAPRDVDLLLCIGGAYFRQRQLKECHAYFSRALEVDPDDGWTHLRIGNLAALYSQDDAETHFEKAIELMPDVACPYWCLADLYNKQGYYSRTEEYYRRAVEIDPSDDQARKKLEEWVAKKLE